MRKLLSIITICFLIIAMFSGCGLLQRLGLQDTENDELRPVSSIVMNEEEANKLSDKMPIRLYFANEDNTKLKLQIRYIPMAEGKKSVNNLASVIVNELINGPDTNSGLNPTIPKEAKQVARIKVDTANATATVDFNKAFVDKQAGDKAAEQMTIYSIVNSLTELKEIQKVKFTINGKIQKEYKGNFKFDSAFPRAPALISKVVDVPSTDAQSIDNEGDGDAKDTLIDGNNEFQDITDRKSVV